MKKILKVKGVYRYGGSGWAVVAQVDGKGDYCQWSRLGPSGKGTIGMGTIGTGRVGTILGLSGRTKIGRLTLLIETGMSVQQFVDDVGGAFRDLWE